MKSGDVIVSIWLNMPWTLTLQCDSYRKYTEKHEKGFAERSPDLNYFSRFNL